MDGLEWLVDLVLGGLRQGQAEAEAEALEERRFHWSLDVHSVVRGGGAACGNLTLTLSLTSNPYPYPYPYP